jgi:hypothetical protein
MQYSGISGVEPMMHYSRHPGRSRRQASASLSRCRPDAAAAACFRVVALCCFHLYRCIPSTDIKRRRHLASLRRNLGTAFLYDYDYERRTFWRIHYYDSRPDRHYSTCISAYHLRDTGGVIAHTAGAQIQARETYRGGRAYYNNRILHSRLNGACARRFIYCPRWTEQ